MGDSLKKFRPDPYSGTKVVLEVYKTDEKNFTPYVSKKNSKSSASKKTSASSLDNEEDTGITLHQGKILETYSFDDLFSVEYNKDYKGISGEGRVTLPYRKKDSKKIYKGVRCLLRVNRFKNLDKPKTNYKTFLGFITDSKFTEKGLELTLSSFEKLLEQEAEVEFKKMHRSQIMTEIIKMAGLKPKVNFKGLRDDVIDYSSGSSNTEKKESNNSDGSMTEAEVEAIAITFHYAGIGTNHDPKKAWSMIGTKKGHNADCYDATAWLYYVYNFKVGIPARDVVGKGYGSSGTHHCIQIKKNGEWIYPSLYSKITKNLKVTTAMKNGGYHVSREPPGSDGKIPPYKNNWYGNRG